MSDLILITDRDIDYADAWFDFTSVHDNDVDPWG